MGTWGQISSTRVKSQEQQHTAESSTRGGKQVGPQNSLASQSPKASQIVLEEHIWCQSPASICMGIHTHTHAHTMHHIYGYVRKIKLHIFSWTSFLVVTHNLAIVLYAHFLWRDQTVPPQMLDGVGHMSVSVEGTSKAFDHPWQIGWSSQNFHVVF